MTFTVVTTPLFDRLARKLCLKHADLAEVLARSVAILTQDPYNASRSHAIRKLTGIKPGEGQYRLRSGRWRIRYDVWEKAREVESGYVGLRREDTYL